MASLLEQAFGTSDLNLYDDVLKVSKTCTPAQLRKAYYKQALQYHPDKNKSTEAKHKFQAISWAYNLLKDPTKRQDYDDDGIIPHDDYDDDDGTDEGAKKSWKDYFDLIFGKLSTNDIDNFAMKYKMSDEEEKDVLDNYVKFKGNLVKMLEYVMLSEERDVPRWMEDYIQPAIAAGKVENHGKTLQKTMGQIEKNRAKETNSNSKKNNEQQESTGGDIDPDETETENSDNDGCNDDEDNYEDIRPSKAVAASKTKPAARKAKPTKAKAKQKKNSDQDLIAAIRNKNGGGNPLASIAARYGVTSMDDDPLDDAAFAKLQSKYKKKK